MWWTWVQNLTRNDNRIPAFNSDNQTNESSVEKMLVFHLMSWWSTIKYFFFRFHLLDTHTPAVRSICNLAIIVDPFRVLSAVVTISHFCSFIIQFSPHQQISPSLSVFVNWCLWTRRDGSKGFLCGLILEIENEEKQTTKQRASYWTALPETQRPETADAEWCIWQKKNRRLLTSSRSLSLWSWYKPWLKQKNQVLVLRDLSKKAAANCSSPCPPLSIRLCGRSDPGDYSPD